MRLVTRVKWKILRFLYFAYMLYPTYLIVNSLRYLGKNISPNAFVFTRKVGKNVRIFGGVFMDKHNSIGDYSYLSGDNFKHNMTRIQHCTIGKYCSIAPNLITLPYSHNLNFLSTFPFHRIDYKVERGTKTSPIKIGNDVWIGSNVIILGGVSISDGAVIGAGSVVTKDVPPYSVAVSNPARIIKKRFSDDMIEKFLSIEWWNMDAHEVVKYQTNPSKFLNLYLEGENYE